MRMESGVSFDKYWMTIRLLSPPSLGYRYGFSQYDSVLVALHLGERKGDDFSLSKINGE